MNSPPDSPERPDNHEKKDKPRFEMRRPSFVSDEDAGLGDTVSRVARSMGVKPCGGCDRRVTTLNRLFAYHRSGRR